MRCTSDNFQSVVMISDIAATSVEQSESRYKDIIERSKYERFQDIFEAEFITADCTKVRHLV